MSRQRLFSGEPYPLIPQGLDPKVEKYLRDLEAYIKRLTGRLNPENLRVIVEEGGELGGSAWDLVQSVGVSGGEIEVPLSSGYERLMLRLDGLVSDTSNVEVRMQMSADGGSTWETGEYAEWTEFFSRTVTDTARSSNRTYLVVTTRSGLSYGRLSDSGEFGGEFFIHQAGDGDYATVIEGFAEYLAVISASAEASICRLALGGLTQANVHNRLRIYLSSGNLTAGTAKLYGQSLD